MINDSQKTNATKSSFAPEWLEIYKERYATFRHFDNLRWQSPTIALVGGSALLGLAKVEGQFYPPYWSLVVFSILCFLSSFLIHQVRNGIRRSSNMLIMAGENIGDNDIPKAADGKGASWWFMLFLIVLGVGSFVFATALFTGCVQNAK